MEYYIGILHSGIHNLKNKQKLFEIHKIYEIKFPEIENEHYTSLKI